MAAGANHLISQLFFDNNDYYNFLYRVRQAGITVPIEAGIMPVTNRKQIERMFRCVEPAFLKNLSASCTAMEMTPLPCRMPASHTPSSRL